MLSTVPKVHPEFIRFARQPMERALGKRVGMAALFATSSSEISSVLHNLDQEIWGYNLLDLKIVERVEGLRHLPVAKAAVPKLPFCSASLELRSSRTCTLYQNALFTANGLMERAENDQPEPNMGFALWEDVATRSRLMGGAFQIIGLMAAHKKHGVDPDVTHNPEFYALKECVLDALLEVAALKPVEKRSELFELAQAQDWFESRDTNGEYVFSDTIRQLAAA